LIIVVIVVWCVVWKYHDCLTVEDADP
jgi:hypothetical protein